MTAALVREIGRLLDALDETQEALEALFEEKRQALTGLDGNQLVALAKREQSLSKQLQGIADRRLRLLAIARQCGVACENLAELSERAGGDDGPALLERIARAREASARLRHASWVHWIISHRSHSHYGQLLEMIAQCGRQAPTYSERPSRETAGGAVLDASI